VRSGSRPGFPRLGPWGVAIELGRPVLLLALFLVISLRGHWLLAAPIALATVFASSILVHDLIHGALGLPRRVNEVLLSLSALLLLKSGHGLRALHFAHHRHCLADGDVEGGVAHDSFVSLALRGPWLAVRSRWEAFRAAPRTRPVQVVETLLDAGVVAVGAWASLRAGAGSLGTSLLVYWAAVVLVTISAPIWGAKIPHMVPWRHPAVRRLARLTFRLTPAAASVLLHELHHRFPETPVSLLPGQAHLLGTTAPSRCVEVARQS
jgi:fatty acid desaturase